MLSRRSIRVKVMQTLYLLDSEADDFSTDKAVKGLLSTFEQSRALFCYLIYFISELSGYAETDAAKKAGKFLPSAGDLSVKTKIAGNSLIWQIREDPGFELMIKEFKPDSIIDRELLKKIYNKLKETPEYEEYNKDLSRNKKPERKMLEFMLNELMLPDELFTGHVEEHFINWDDDGGMMQALVMNYLNKPVKGAFQQFLSAEKRDFGVSLLRTVIEKREVSLEMIKPKLKNWDAERIAALDLILLQMGLCEFLYFDTIPTKVTINEYIDLAKEYSTPQSGQFVNGLLDTIHKELQASGKIQKKVYKNSTI